MSDTGRTYEEWCQEVEAYYDSGTDPLFQRELTIEEGQE